MQYSQVGTFSPLVSVAQVGLISSVKGKIPQSVVAGWLFPLLLPPEGTSALDGPTFLFFETSFVFARSVLGLLDAELGGNKRAKERVGAASLHLRDLG